MKTIKFLTFVLAIFANLTQAQTNTTPTFVTNTIIGKKFVWERVTEVGTTNTSIRRVDEVAPTATVDTNVPPVAKAKADKDAVPLLIARPATNSSSQVYHYGQYATNRYGDGPGEVQRQAPGTTQWTGSAQPSGGAQNYTVDQRPIDQGTQPAPVAHYATHQGSYATAPATYPVHAEYPVYAEPGSYFPVAHYPNHGYSYPTYGYGVGYGAHYGYTDSRRLFGISFDAIVSPAHSYSPGWSVRGGHHHSHQQNYPTHNHGRRGGR